MLSGPQTSMPLSNGAHALIRTNLEEIQEGKKVRLVAIGTLTDLQLDAINRQRAGHNYLPIVPEVVFLGRHIHKSRIGLCYTEGRPHKTKKAAHKMSSLSETLAARLGNNIFPAAPAAMSIL